jgi:hypothetical protein
MLNAATSSAITAITANTVSAVRRKPRKPLLMSLKFIAASCAPVIACTPPGRTACTRPANGSGVTPFAALTMIWVY